MYSSDSIIPKEDAVMTPEQVAEELSMSLYTVKKLMRAREIPATKVGKLWRTTRGEIYGYLENQIRMESGVRASRPTHNGAGDVQVRRRSARVSKGRKRTPAPKP